MKDSYSDYEKQVSRTEAFADDLKKAQDEIAKYRSYLSINALEPDAEPYCAIDRELAEIDKLQDEIEHLEFTIEMNRTYWKKEVDNLHDEIDELVKENKRIGFWLSAALDDPHVCQDMKDDINIWMKATDKHRKK